MTENNEKKELNVSAKYNPETGKYEADKEELNKEIEKINEKEKKLIEDSKQSEKHSKDEKKNSKKPSKKKKETSFRTILFVLLASFLIASLWDSVPIIKDSIHAVLDPSAGALLNWNVNIGLLIVVLIINIIVVIIQKYATDQEALKEIKKKQKEMQKEMKKHKGNKEKMMEMQKEQFKSMPKQMKLSMRGIVFTSVPFVLFFRWFNDYFASLGEYQLWFGMSWFLFYIIATLIISSILRKVFKVV